MANYFNNIINILNKKKIPLLNNYYFFEQLSAHNGLTAQTKSQNCLSVTDTFPKFKTFLAMFF